jgi:hypothetical protein
MNIGEIIEDAVRYPLSNPKNLLIFGIIFVFASLYSNFMTTGAANIPLILILFLIALIAFVFIFGYELRILRATLAGFSEIPEFDDPADMFLDGLKVVIVGIVYTILLAIILGILFLVFTIAAGGLTKLSPANGGSMILMGIIIIFILIVALFIYPLILMSLTNMVYNNNDIEYALKFGEIFNKISNIGWGNFLVWYLVTGIIYLILLVIGIIIIGFFALIHLKIIGGILYPLIIGSYMSFFIYRSAALFYMSGDYETGDLGYLECDNCKGYYELQNGESPEDFSECECGGKLVYNRK